MSSDNGREDNYSNALNGETTLRKVITSTFGTFGVQTPNF